MVSHCACPTRVFRDCALHEHRRPSSPPPCLFLEPASNECFPILHSSLRGSGRGCPSLRASNEHSFIVRVLRARRAPGRSLLPLGTPSKFLSQCRLLQSFLIEIQGSRNSFPRSMSPLQKSLLHINQFHSPLLSGYPAGPGIALLQSITHIERSRPCRT